MAWPRVSDSPGILASLIICTHSRANPISIANAWKHAVTNSSNRRADKISSVRKLTAPLAGEVLISVGETVYEWDIATDKLSWADNATGLLGIEAPNQIATGREYTRLVAPRSTTNRNEAVQGSEKKDGGDGVYYQIQYALAADALGCDSDLWIEDSGRWFAGKDGKPARAHGIVRIINERRTLEERFDRLSRFDDLPAFITAVT